jgi:hypothetical protein
MDRNPAKRYLTLKQFLDDIDRVRRGPEGGTGSTAPFGRAGLGGLAASSGKRREPAATMLGVGAINEARTKQMDIQIPPEALREAAALDAAVASGGGGASAPTPSTTARMGSDAAVAAAQAVAVQQPVPAQPQSPPQAQPAPAAPPQPGGAGSPWAPPATSPAAQPGAMTPAAQAVQAAAPAIAAAAAPPQGPVMPATAKAAPAASPATTLPGGKKKQDVREKKKSSKGKFRETMWFKKGDLDAAAAEAAAHDKEGAAPDKADSLPMEERYSDDGTITTSDAARYSLKTGHTGAMPVMRDRDPGSSVSEGDLIGEMKGGSRFLLIVIGIAVIAIIAVVLAFAI